MRTREWLAAAVGLAVLTSMVPAPATLAASPVQVTLNGQPLALDPGIFIQDGRTLAPVRAIVEALGAEPIWNESDRTVVVSSGDRYLKLKVGSRLACVAPGCAVTQLLDVPATIVSGRTFIPVRVLAEAMGVGIEWDEPTRTVRLTTSPGASGPGTSNPGTSSPGTSNPGTPSPGTSNPGTPGTPIPASPVTVQGVTQGQVITGPTTLRATGLDGTYVYFYLVDPATRKGRVVAAGADVNAAYTYTPDPTLAGRREIMAAVRRSDGTLVYSNPVAVTVQPDTRVQITGLTPGGTFSDPATIGHTINFVATHVVYQMVDTATGAVTDLATLGPGEGFTWYPPTSANGPKVFQVVAYDLDGNAYRSDPVPVLVNTGYRTTFSSVSEGERVTGRARTLSVSANYPIQAVRFILDGRVLATENNYWWTYGPADNGSHTLTVEVTDERGVVHTIGPIRFQIDTEPGLWLYGVGPGQVITDEIKLMAMPNVPADTIKFYAEQDGVITLISEAKPGQYVTWTPPRSGPLTIYANAWLNGYWVVSTQPFYVTAYMQPTWGPQPIVEKSRFKDFAAAMAVKSYQETGMSAALQVAQAILETGWGQYIPVDKYTGQMSNNLFGIKGTGSAGSIISTTWEVYNGQSYTVDARFRAYNSPAESWQDHKDLLLTASWYDVFRQVMSDPVLGAWGLRKGGYATDPQYPVKLINIMCDNDLFALDEVQF